MHASCIHEQGSVWLWQLLMNACAASWILRVLSPQQAAMITAEPQG